MGPLSVLHCILPNPVANEVIMVMGSSCFYFPIVNNASLRMGVQKEVPSSEARHMMVLNVKTPTPLTRRAVTKTHNPPAHVVCTHSFIPKHTSQPRRPPADYAATPILAAMASGSCPPVQQLHAE